MYVFELLQNWVRKAHPKLSFNAACHKYFKREKGRTEFKYYDKEKGQEYKLFRLETIPIKQHVMVKAGVNPFDIKDYDYFEERSEKA